MKNKPKKQVTLIDQDNNVLSSLDLLTAHAHPSKFHRAVSVWLIRNYQNNLQVLLQKRSKNKIVGANQWGNAICGNVLPTESFLECALRRLKEEIGVTQIELKPAYLFEYKIYSNAKYGEHELDQVYYAYYDGAFKLNFNETSEISWVNLNQLKQEIKKHQIIRAQETLKYQTQELKKLTPALKIKLNEKNFKITPWTSLMLGDNRLWKILENFA